MPWDTYSLLLVLIERIVENGQIGIDFQTIKYMRIN